MKAVRYPAMGFFLFLIFFFFLTEWEEISSPINPYLVFLNAGQDKSPPGA